MLGNLLGFGIYGNLECVIQPGYSGNLKPTIQVLIRFGVIAIGNRVLIPVRVGSYPQPAFLDIVRKEDSWRFYNPGGVRLRYVKHTTSDLEVSLNLDPPPTLY